MYRFSAFNYNAAAQTVEIGSGLIWDDVYAALAPYNVNVVGGRVTGVGVAGFTLGGGKRRALLVKFQNSWDVYMHQDILGSPINMD